MLRYRLLQSLLMAAFGLYLLWNIASGTIYLYINQRFVPLMLFGGVAALALAMGVWPYWPKATPVPLSAHISRLPLWGFAVVAAPLALAVLIPAKPLGANAITTRGVNNGAPLSVSGSTNLKLEIPSEQRTILDWIRSYNYSNDTREFDGQVADVIGFVYHEQSLSGTQFMVGRFVVTCCAADGSAIALIVDWPEASQLEDNSWVRVKGPVKTTTLNGRPLPRITAESVEAVPQPDQPYMYP